MERVRQALDALEPDDRADARPGEPIDPSFEQFMEQFGDMFPGNPQSLDELLEQLAAQMAAVQAALDSMSPEQRAQLQALAESLFEDMDLRWQVDRLAGNLQKAVPGAGWGRRYRFGGDQSGRAGRGGRVGSPARVRWTSSSSSCSPQRHPAHSQRSTWSRRREYLGDDGARSLQRLANLARELEEAGLINRREGRYELTAKAIRRIGQKALSELFSKLTKDRPAGHRAAFVGHRPRARGSDQALRIRRPVHACTSSEQFTTRCDRSGSGTPVRLLPDDFEIERTEALVRSSTVLMVDLSLSMPMRDNFLAAKKVAIALHTLISTQFPRDFLGIVGFSEVAREIKPEELPAVSWDYVYGTNMQHGLLLAPAHARSSSRHEADHHDHRRRADGAPGPERRQAGTRSRSTTRRSQRPSVARLSEVVRCTQAGITINTFMLDPDHSLQGFVEQMSRLNRGQGLLHQPGEPRRLRACRLPGAPPHQALALGGRIRCSGHLGFGTGRRALAIGLFHRAVAIASGTRHVGSVAADICRLSAGYSPRSESELETVTRSGRKSDNP